MKAVDRANYVVHGSAAYQDAPQAIGYGATISAPHMHAACLENLKQWLQPGARVLDVGSGTGYLTALFSEMVGPSGLVVGVDHIPELVQMSRDNFHRDGRHGMLERGEVILEVADGRNGWPAKAPYDCIHVGAAAPTVPPALVEQLKPGGRLIIPVGEQNAGQELLAVEKGQDGKVTKRSLMGVVYVPLTNPKHQLSRQH